MLQRMPVNSPALVYGETADLLQRAGELTPEQLAEAVWLDMRRRAEAGEHAAAEEYLRRFPAIESSAACAVDVIYGEFLVRKDRGEQPAGD
jgi:hypothetical protein